MRQLLGTTILLLLTLFLGKAQGQVKQKNKDSGVGIFSKELDDYIATALKDWDLPGIAIAVVKGGKVIVTKGYGVRELGKPERVDEKTIFDIASVTKQFTASAIASLVDEKKMNWDDPVKKYIPTIEFPDPYLTANITIRDLLCHRTGIHSTNSAMFLAKTDRSELLHLVKNMELESPFRTKWIYSNLGFTIAGQAAVNASGLSWQKLITQKLINPLEMQRTTADFMSAPRMGNVAAGHNYSNGIQTVMQRGGIQRVVTEPAGAVQSCVEDLAKWMIFQLGDGTYQGKRILSKASLNEIQSPQIAVPTTKEFRANRQLKYFAAYGLGWQIFDYRGSTLLWHSGNGDGQIARLALVPDAQLGVVVLVNSWKIDGPFNNAIVSRILDHYLNLPTKDYLSEYRKSWEEAATRDSVDEIKAQESRIKNTQPTLPLEKYTGVYKDKLGLDVKVTLDKDTLKMQYGGGEIAVLKHWHYDTFRAQWEVRRSFVHFSLSSERNISELKFEIFRDKIIASRLQ